MQAPRSLWDSTYKENSWIANDYLSGPIDLLGWLNQRITANGWTQAEAAQRLNVSQPRISHLSRCQIDRFSVDALLNMATLAGLQIEIAVRAK